MNTDDRTRDWFFTFGSNHTHPTTGQTLTNAYVRINGTFASARVAMVAAFDNRWAFQYESADEAGVEKYKLTEVEVPSAPVDLPAEGSTILVYKDAIGGNRATRVRVEGALYRHDAPGLPIEVWGVEVNKDGSVRNYFGRPGSEWRARLDRDDFELITAAEGGAA
jgi:hypothetical protein